MSNVLIVLPLYNDDNYNYYYNYYNNYNDNYSINSSFHLPHLSEFSFSHSMLDKVPLFEIWPPSNSYVFIHLSLLNIFFHLFGKLYIYVSVFVRILILSTLFSLFFNIFYLSFCFVIIPFLSYFVKIPLFFSFLFSNSSSICFHFLVYSFFLSFFCLCFASSILQSSITLTDVLVTRSSDKWKSLQVFRSQLVQAKRNNRRNNKKMNYEKM